MPGRLEFDVAPLPQRSRTAGEPLRLLLLGDFSGRGARGLCEPATLAARPALRIDHDAFDAVFRRLAPQVEVDLGGERQALAFDSLDDFHPDRLLARMPALQRLQALRRRLQDPARFAAAAAELAADPAVPAAADEPPPAAPAAGDGGAEAGGAAGDAGLLGRLLAGGASATGRTGGAADTGTTRSAADTGAASSSGATGAAALVDGWLRRLVAPHVVADTAARQQPYLAAVDAATAELLRALLHDPSLQALEARWRAVHWLLSNLELDDGALQLHLYDVGAAELAADLQGDAAPAGDAGGLQRALVQRSAEKQAPWALWVGEWSFGAGADDVALLSALGTLAAAAGAPLLAGAAPSLAGWSGFDAPGERAQPAADDAARWQALRRSPPAAWLGLLAPRLLLRRPYGARSEPIDAFDFDELGAAPAHADLLWAPPAYAGALVHARRATLQDGDDASAAHDIDDLPAVTLEVDGEPAALSCAESHLGDAAVQALRGLGLTPLVGDRRRHAVRLLPLQSIADPPKALGDPAR